MTQVFISYRHVSPDQDLAGFLEGYLKSRRLDVFIDTQMLVGDKWVEEIERRIRAASFFVALPSADSIRSDMGSLLATAIAAAKQRQRKTFYYDFQRLGPDQLDSLDSLLRYLAQRLARDLKTTTKPAEMWDETLSAKDNLTYFIEDAILADAESPVLFFFDEADQVFGYPYRDQFFSLIRAWHNDRAVSARRPALSRAAGIVCSVRFQDDSGGDVERSVERIRPIRRSPAPSQLGLAKR